MITQEKAPGWRPGAGTLRRRGLFSLTSACSIANSGPNVNSHAPPSHLTPAEANLWLAAEAARADGDRQKFWDLRRLLLLTQAEQYGTDN